MTITSSGLPTPELETSSDAQPYWEGAARGRLVLPRCRLCEHVIWYPRPFCPECGQQDVEWFEAGGEGVIYSFTTVRRSQGDYEASAPYVVAFVELKEGPRVLTNIAGDVDRLEVGQAVQALFDRDPNGNGILRFETG